MKKIAKISIGAAGVTTAAVIIAGISGGTGFKDVNMVSVSGIMAEAQPTEESAVDTQSVVASDTGITAGAKAVQEGADVSSVDSLVTAAESVAEITNTNTEAEAVESQITVTYTSESVSKPVVVNDKPAEAPRVDVKKDNSVAVKSTNLSNGKKVSVKKAYKITPAEAEHVHDWQPEYKTVRHLPATHIEKQFVQTGYTVSRREAYSYKETELSMYKNTETAIDENKEEKLVHSDYAYFINGVEVTEDEYEAELDALRAEAEANGESDKFEAEAVSGNAPIGYEVDVEVVDKESYDEEVLVGYNCPCGDKKEVVAENIKEDAELADDIVEIIDDEDEERTGCASRGKVLFSDDNEPIGYLHECSVCETQEVCDLDDNEVYSADSIEDFLSEEEAVELLK